MEIPQGVKCRICSKESNIMKRCTRCQTVYYCSRECQVVDWSTHKTECSRNPSDLSLKAQDHEVEGRQDVSKSATGESASHSQGTVTRDSSDNLGNIHRSQGGLSLAVMKSVNTVDFQKAFDDLKKPHQNLDGGNLTVKCNSECRTYVNRNMIMRDLPRLEAGQRTFTITVKGNKRKEQISLQEGWEGRDIMKMISHKTTIPLDKMKLIHKGKVVTEKNVKPVAQNRAVLQVIGEPCESSDGVDSRDIDILMKQLSVERNEAIRALRDKGDVVDAILYLTNK